MASRIAFTLPISCQICLCKVKDPVVCSNHHVFCKECIDLWLQRNPQCPACRVSITTENPYRAVLGGLNPNTGIDNEHVSSRELRRSRMDLLYKDYESEIEHLQVEIDQQKKEIFVLRAQCATDNKSSVTQSASNHPISATSQDTSAILVLQNRLTESTSLYKGVKAELERHKKEFVKLKDDVVALERENEKLKLDLINRSPRRYGRFAVSSLESRVQTSDKEIQQLNRALEKSDSYITDLEEKLTSYRKRIPPSGAGDMPGSTFVCRNCSEISHGITLPGSSRDTSYSSTSDQLSTVNNSTSSHIDFQVSRDFGINRENAAFQSHKSFSFDLPSADCSMSERDTRNDRFLKPNKIERISVRSARPVETSRNFENPTQLLDKMGDSEEVFSSIVTNSIRQERNYISSASRGRDFSFSWPDKRDFAQPDKEDFARPDKRDFSEPDKQDFSGSDKRDFSGSDKRDFSLPSQSENDLFPSQSPDTQSGESSCKKKLRFMMPSGNEDKRSRTKNDRSWIDGSVLFTQVEPYTISPIRTFFNSGESTLTVSHTDSFAREQSSLVGLEKPTSSSEQAGPSKKLCVEFGKSNVNNGCSLSAKRNEQVDQRQSEIDGNDRNGVDMNVSLTPEMKDCLRLMDEAEVKVKHRKNELLLDRQF